MSERNNPADRENLIISPLKKENENKGSLERITFPIVGIGASAGGLEALEQFFRSMPSDCGMTFVIVQHLDPNHKSILGEILSRYTQMSVTEVGDYKDLEPNHIYIAPPNYYTRIVDSTFRLTRPDSSQGLHWYIDSFF